MCQEISISSQYINEFGSREGQKLGWGGISYIMQLFGCSRNTIVQGIEDLGKMDETTIDKLRIRKKGGGRKSILSTSSQSSRGKNSN